MANDRKPLTARQERFIAEYAIDLNATQAAIRAGYSARVANREGSRLLSNAVIAAEIAKRKSAQLEKLEIDALRVLREYAALATVDMRSFWDEHGDLKPISEWTPEQGAAVAGFEVLMKNAAAGDDVIDRIHKFKLWDKTRALEALAKHFGLLVDRVHVSGELEAVSARLLAARKRLAERKGDA